MSEETSLTMIDSPLFVHEDDADRNGDEEEEDPDDDSDDGADVGLVFAVTFGLFRAVNIREFCNQDFLVECLP